MLTVSRIMALLLVAILSQSPLIASNPKARYAPKAYDYSYPPLYQAVMAPLFITTLLRKIHREERQKISHRPASTYDPIVIATLAHKINSTKGSLVIVTHDEFDLYKKILQK